MMRVKAILALGLTVLTLAACSDGATTGAAQAAAGGEQIFNQFCFSCHMAGISGAPKPGDTADWAPRLAKGETLLLDVTRNGIVPVMPPMGMCLQCSDEELLAAIRFMSAAP